KQKATRALLRLRDLGSSADLAGSLSQPRPLWGHRPPLYPRVGVAAIRGVMIGLARRESRWIANYRRIGTTFAGAGWGSTIDSRCLSHNSRAARFSPSYRC